VHRFAYSCSKKTRKNFGRGRGEEEGRREKGPKERGGGKGGELMGGECELLPPSLGRGKGRHLLYSENAYVQTE
jgi:hypothetical protein